jgi:2-polyprenyl-3-methyl-5-hydroxy-6-metoxy-1,4-benzoquinol methylase
MGDTATGATTAGIGPGVYAAWRSSALGALTERIEHDLIFRLAGDVRGRQALDAGCGDGSLSIALAKRGALVAGVDCDPMMLTAAQERAHFNHVDISFQEGRVEDLPFEDGGFDLVLAVTVLCFVPDINRAIAEMTRVLRPGGRLVLGELNRWSLWAARRRLKAWLGSRLWREVRFRSASELKEAILATGLKVEMIEGAVFYPPVTALARLMAPIDSYLGRLTTIGAAFIAVSARKPNPDSTAPSVKPVPQ